MNIKQFLMVMAAATGVCWLAWALVLFQADPTRAEAPVLLLFYFSLFFALVGSFFLISFAWRKIFHKFSLEYRLVGTSFRQSCFFAILIVGALFLASQSFLTWWNLILLILAVGIVEFFFISARRPV